MGTYYNGVHISGNFRKLTKRKPPNWIFKGYKIIIPFRFKWRHRVGKVECTCNECEEHYQPYYGTSWFHSKECELVRHIENRPQILNLNQYSNWDYTMIAQTD